MELYNAQVEVLVGRGIEDRDMFATDAVEAGEMIIEYGGTRVTTTQADVREAAYHENGWKQENMVSVYGVDNIIDDTLQGNRARYANPH